LAVPATSATAGATAVAMRTFRRLIPAFWRPSRKVFSSKLGDIKVAFHFSPYKLAK
jgi:hypothetical protein